MILSKDSILILDFIGQTPEVYHFGDILWSLSSGLS